MKKPDELANRLAMKAIEMAGPSSHEIERYCWMVVHEYRHGVMPVEYDIRDIEESLYMSVLSIARTKL